MHCKRRLLTAPIARDVTDPGPVPIRVLDSGVLMGGTVAIPSSLGAEQAPQQGGRLRRGLSRPIGLDPFRCELE